MPATSGPALPPWRTQSPCRARESAISITLRTMLPGLTAEAGSRRVRTACLTGTVSIQAGTTRPVEPATWNWEASGRRAAAKKWIARQPANTQPA